MKPVFTYSKKIKDGTGIISHQITDSPDIAKIDQVIQKLQALPRAQTLPLDDIRLKSNPKKWITSLLKSYPKKVKGDEMESLLADFTDSMKTRMREETKYVVSILMEKQLILCHSIFGEETITPEWKIIPRMLDGDNVLRFVHFADTPSGVSTKYWEREATSSFIEWLGLPRKQAFLFGGRYRICCEVDSITTEFQLTEQEMERWLSEHSEFKDGKVRFTSPIQILNVNEVRVAGKRYQNTEDFIQDYEAERRGIPRYQKEYKRINEKHLPMLVKYYDEQTQVVRIEGEEETTEVMKDTPLFDILFANEHIELRASYRTDIAKRFINGEPVRIFHSGHNFNAKPFSFGHMDIFNSLQLNELITQTAEYYNKTNLQDRNLDILLKYAFLKLLSEANKNCPVSYVFEALAQETSKEIIFSGRLSKIEDTVIEYKSQDFISGSHKKVIQSLSEDIRKKLEISKCKIYIFGIESTGICHPVPASKLINNRVENIQKDLQEELPSTRILAFPVCQKEVGFLYIVVVQQ